MDDNIFRANRMLKAKKELFGESHPKTAAAYNNLAMLYQDAGEYEAALEFYLKGLKIDEDVFGENHPDTATTYNNIAELYQAMGKYEAALGFSLKSLKIREEILGESHPDTAISHGYIKICVNMSLR